jgi:hypothetical protein
MVALPKAWIGNENQPSPKKLKIFLGRPGQKLAPSATKSGTKQDFRLY